MSDSTRKIGSLRGVVLHIWVSCLLKKCSSELRIPQFFCLWHITKDLLCNAQWLKFLPKNYFDSGSWNTKFTFLKILHPLIWYSCIDLALFNFALFSEQNIPQCVNHKRRQSKKIFESCAMSVVSSKHRIKKGGGI